MQDGAESRLACHATPVSLLIEVRALPRPGPPLPPLTTHDPLPIQADEVLGRDRSSKACCCYLRVSPLLRHLRNRGSSQAQIGNSTALSRRNPYLNPGRQGKSGVTESLRATPSAAALVDGHGRVIQIRGQAEIDADVLGAAARSIRRSAAMVARQANQVATKLIMVENEEGIVVLVPLPRDYILAILADSAGMLGMLRFETKKMAPELRGVIEGRGVYS